MDNIYEFNAIPEREVFMSDTFKIYGCSIDSQKNPDLKINQYGNITIKGNISELAIGAEYIFKAREVEDNYGTGYIVLNYQRKRPSSINESRMFLSEILTANQTEVLLEAYPDIIDRVINNRLDDIDLNKTKGIKEYIFEVVKRKIIENYKLAELVNEFQGMLNINIIRKLYMKYPSIEEIREALQNQPYECLCELNGIGFKTADSLLLDIDKKSKENIKNHQKPIVDFKYDLKTSYQRAKACVMFLLGQNESDNGNTYMDIKTLKKEFMRLVPETYSNLPLILKNDNDVVFNRDKLIIASKKAYQTEMYIAKRIKEALMINTQWECDYKKYRKLDNFVLTDDQSKTSEYMCKYNFVMLVGYGGAGKSSSTQAFINMCNDYKKNCLLVAPTGRAAKVLKEYTKMEASTIHRGFGYSPTLGWAYNEDNPAPYDVVICDEFSMTDIYLFRHLLEGIDFNRTKLLIIGDDAQLPSVGAGNVLYDLLHSNMIPTIMLDKIFRYGVGGLSTVATNMREGKTFLNAKCNSMQVFGEDKSYIFMPVVQEKIVNYTVSLYHKLIKSGKYKPEDIAVLAAQNIGNYGTFVLNKKLQAVINKENENNKLVCGEDDEYRLNDIIMNYSNDYKAIIYDKNLSKDVKPRQTFIANGESGIVSEVMNDSIVADYNGTLIYYTKNTLKNVKLSYAMSCHKSQGGSFKVVILVTPKSHRYSLNSNLLYVGVSRAKLQCYHLGDASTINSALQKKINYNRKTLLRDFLKMDMEDLEYDERTA